MLARFIGLIIGLGSLLLMAQQGQGSYMAAYYYQLDGKYIKMLEMLDQSMKEGGNDKWPFVLGTRMVGYPQVEVLERCRDLIPDSRKDLKELLDFFVKLSNGEEQIKGNKEQIVQAYEKSASYLRQEEQMQLLQTIVGLGERSRQFNDVFPIFVKLINRLHEVRPNANILIQGAQKAISINELDWAGKWLGIVREEKKLNPKMQQIYQNYLLATNRNSMFYELMENKWSEDPKSVSPGEMFLLMIYRFDAGYYSQSKQMGQELFKQLQLEKENKIILGMLAKLDIWKVAAEVHVYPAKAKKIIKKLFKKDHIKDHLGNEFIWYSCYQARRISFAHDRGKDWAKWLWKMIDRPEFHSWGNSIDIVRERALLLAALVLEDEKFIINRLALVEKRYGNDPKVMELKRQFSDKAHQTFVYQLEKILSFSEFNQWEKAESLISNIKPTNKDELFVVNEAAISIAINLKQNDKAISFMQEQLRERPEDPWLKNNLGYTLLLSKGFTVEAESLIRDAYEKTLDTKPLAILDSYAWMIYLKGETDAALKILEPYEELLASGESLWHLKEMLESAGDVEAAERIKNRAILMDQSLKTKDE